MSFESQPSRLAEQPHRLTVDEIFEDKEQTPEERRQEMAQLLKGSEEIFRCQREEGSGLIGETIASTFQESDIEGAKIDRHFYLFPKQEKGNLIVVSDLHGDSKALYEAAKMLEEDENNHLLSLGDVVAHSGAETRDQLGTLVKLLRLHNAYPNRVHLCRGNIEAEVVPAEGFGDEMYLQQGLEGFQQNIARAQRVFQKQPVGFVMETGAVGVHGLLPRGVKEKGQKKLHYRNLAEINSFSDYSDEPMLSGREIRRMLWGEIRERSKGSRGEFKRGPEGMVSGSKGVLKSLNAVGGSVLIRGHQHSLARRKGAAYSVDFNGRVGTFVSHELEGERRIAVIPLNKKVQKLTQGIFRKV